MAGGVTHCDRGCSGALHSHKSWAKKQSFHLRLVARTVRSVMTSQKPITQVSTVNGSTVVTLGAFF